jgi:hypothetical protein
VDAIATILASIGLGIGENETSLIQEIATYLEFPLEIALNQSFDPKVWIECIEMIQYDDDGTMGLNRSGPMTVSL